VVPTSHAASGLVRSSGRAQTSVRLSRLRVARLPGRAKRSAVQLRFVLSGPARVRFLVYGPAPRCTLSGHFTIAGHTGVNRMRFRGRIRGRLLPAGVYTLVTQATAGAGRLSGPRVTVAIDARGVRPVRRVPWRNCRSATKPEPFTAIGPVPSVTPRQAGVKAAIVTSPALPAVGSVDRPSRQSSASISPGTGKPWLIIAILLALLASVTLLGLAVVEPRYAATRFWLVRVLDDHRERVALIGAACLVAAGVLFLLTRLPM
jgi:hypothetical protein